MDKIAKITKSGFSKKSLTLKLAIIILGLIGMCISGYLTYIHYRDLSSICLFGTGCDNVLSSQYSSIWGIPLALFGLLMYIVLTLLVIWSFRIEEECQNRLDLGMYGIALSGTLFTVYLYYLEIFEIHSFCTWCIGSSLLIFSLLMITVINLAAASRR